MAEAMAVIWRKISISLIDSFTGKRLSSGLMSAIACFKQTQCTGLAHASFWWSLYRG